MIFLCFKMKRGHLHKYGVMLKLNEEVRMPKVMTIQNILEYRFKNARLLDEALTHCSFSSRTAGNDYAEIDNERLEFLGDSVLSMVVSENLFIRKPNFTEGEMSLIRTGIIREETLAEASIKLNIGSYLKFGKGEERSGGRHRQSILADAFEALVGAIYLDGGLNKAKTFILKNLGEKIKSGIELPGLYDYKTKLQEILQAKKGDVPEYRISAESGPDHDKTFETEIIINCMVVGKGVGKTKKESEQNAAKFVLENDLNNI